MNNKKIGTNWEEEWAKMLKSMGFGVMRSRGRKGQSADLIAFKDNVVYFCECKHCDDDLFICDRIENNQKTAPTYFKEWCNCTNYYFAIKFKSGINVIHYDIIKDKKEVRYNSGYEFSHLKRNNNSVTNEGSI